MAQGMTITASIKIRQAADIIYISVTFIKVMVFNQVKHKVSVNTLYINIMHCFGKETGFLLQQNQMQFCSNKIFSKYCAYLFWHIKLCGLIVPILFLTHLNSPSSYSNRFPGLVHFIIVDRTHNEIIAPNVSKRGEIVSP